MKRKLQVQALLLAAELIAYELPRDNFHLPSYASIGSQTIFLHDDGVHGREIWTSDGTKGGTHLVKDVEPGAGAPNIRAIHEGDGEAFFVVDANDHSEIWRTDGTESGTEELFSVGHDVTPIIFIQNVLSSGLVVHFFDPVGFPVWIPFDGGPHQVIRGQTEMESSVRLLGVANDTILFSERIDSQPISLFVTDGTMEGNIAVGGSGLPSGNSLGFFHPSNYGADAEGFIVELNHSFYHINQDGMGHAVPNSDFSSFNFVEEAHGSVFVDLAGASILMTAEGAFALNGAPRAPLLTPSGDGFVFVNRFNQISHFDLDTKQTTAFSNAPSADRFTKAEVVGDRFLYDSDPTEAIQLVSYHSRFRSSDELVSLESGAQILLVGKTESTAMFLIEDSVGSTLRLVDLVSPDLETLFEFTANAFEINSPFQQGQFVVVNVPSDFGDQLISIDLATGHAVRLTRSGNNGQVQPIERTLRHTHTPVIFPIGSESFTFQSKGRVWLSDGTREGTQSVLDGATLIFQDDNYLQHASSSSAVVAGNGDVYFPWREETGVVQVSSMGTTGATIEKIPLPEMLGFGASPDGIFYFDGTDVKELVGGSTDSQVRVSDYPSRQVQSVSPEELASGDPFANRAAYVDSSGSTITAYASDVTPEGTGVVDSIAAISDRLGESVSGNFLISGGAIHAELSTESGRICLVERPTEQGLRNILPIGTSCGYSPIRVDSAWIIPSTSFGAGGDVWIWEDSEPEPRLLGQSPGTFEVALAGAIFYQVGIFESDVKTDIVAINQGETVSLQSLAQLPGSEFTGSILGHDEAGAIVAAYTSGDDATAKLYLWDGTESGLRPLSNLEDLMARLDQTDEFNNQMEILGEFALMNSGHEIYRAPKSQRTVPVTGSQVQIGIATDRLEIASESQAANNERTVGESLTIDASQSTGKVQISIESQASVPANGLQIDLPSDAEVEVMLPETATPIRYDFQNGHINLMIGGRTIALRYSNSIVIVESDLGTSGNNRDLLFHQPSTNVDFSEPNENRVRVTAGDSQTIEFLSPLSHVRVVGRANEQQASFDILSRVENLEWIDDTIEGSAWTLAYPDGLDVESAMVNLNGYQVRGQIGPFSSTIDIMDRPLHNPFREFDVNASQDVTALDALQVINHIAQGIGYQLTKLSFFPDVNNDLEVSALDALLVINVLASQFAETEQPLRAGGFTGSLLHSDEDDHIRLNDESIRQLF